MRLIVNSMTWFVCISGGNQWWMELRERILVILIQHRLINAHLSVSPTETQWYQNYWRNICSMLGSNTEDGSHSWRLARGASISSTSRAAMKLTSARSRKKTKIPLIVSFAWPAAVHRCSSLVSVSWWYDLNCQFLTNKFFTYFGIQRRTWWLTRRNANIAIHTSNTTNISSIV